MAWTKADDLINAWIGDGVPTDSDRVKLWLGKAEREIRHRVPDLQTRIDAELAEDPVRKELLETAKDIAVAMVTRVLRNPDGARQRQWTSGPFAESMTVGGDNPGTLYLTSDELAKLQGVKPGGAFTVSMIPAASPYYEAPA